MIIATAAIHPTMSHDDLRAVFDMISTLLWIDFAVVGTPRGPETARVPSPANATRQGGAALSRHD
jgi:hypothetical protein